MWNYIVTKKVKIVLPPHYVIVGELCKSRKSKVITLTPSGVLCPYFQDKFGKHPVFCADGKIEKPTPEQMMAKTIIGGDIFLTNKIVIDKGRIVGVTENDSIKIPTELLPYEGDVTKDLLFDYVNITDPFGNVLTPNGRVNSEE